jgi:hypothetical protein
MLKILCATAENLVAQDLCTPVNVLLKELTLSRFSRGDVDQRPPVILNPRPGFFLITTGNCNKKKITIFKYSKLE